VSTPALSVIVPAYNQASWIGGCLRSLRESGVPDLEVIVVDDGSTDNVRELLARDFPEARYQWRPNSGNPSAPRNDGFAISRGRYVAFLDADDSWLPGVPARAVALLDRHPAVGVLFADARVGNPAEGYVSWIDRPGLEAFHKLPKRELEPGFSAPERSPMLRQMATWNSVFLGACVIRPEVFAATGGFDPTYWGGEDWEVLLRMAAVTDFGFLAEPLANYTRHPGNVTNNRDKMTGGFCQCLRNVLARGELTPADRRYVRGRLRDHLFSYAYLAYDRGDIVEARRRFADAVRAGNHRPLTVALAVACQLPEGLLRRVRSLMQRVRSSK
jgi:glycosyltransferase involved in cell wall biosynthesis